MRTQISCPNCGTPYTAEVHQVIDVGRHPELKAALLGGQLNVAVCPNCGAAGQLASALVYHDPADELFMVYVPQELNMDQMQREQYIGQLTRQVVDNTPAEQRRAYMFQPMTMFTMQSLLEKVLETEGITKEMIERQQKQAELLNTLITADKDVADVLIEERADEIDEVFFAMLRQYVEAASQLNDDKQLLPLVNLQARLMTETETGRRLEKQQVALHKLNQDAKAAGGLTPGLLLEHVLKYQDDPALVSVLGQVGIQALTYEFFTGLTEEIDRLEAAGDEAAVARLSEIRTELLQLQEEIQDQTRQILGEAEAALAEILEAEDRKAALRTHAEQLDDAFMYVLAAEISRAQQSEDEERLSQLTSLRDLIVEELESQTPPEIRFLNRLVSAESDEDVEALIEKNKGLISPELITVIDALREQTESSGQAELNERLLNVRRLLNAELV
ncbi:MAG: CpXC domain-containing protein [Candidatus Promineifilaceae bacterium]